MDDHKRIIRKINLLVFLLHIVSLTRSQSVTVATGFSWAENMVCVYNSTEAVLWVAESTRGELWTVTWEDGAYRQTLHPASAAFSRVAGLTVNHATGVVYTLVNPAKGGNCELVEVIPHHRIMPHSQTSRRDADSPCNCGGDPNVVSYASHIASEVPWRRSWLGSAQRRLLLRKRRRFPSRARARVPDSEWECDRGGQARLQR